ASGALSPVASQAVRPPGQAGGRQNADGHAAVSRRHQFSSPRHRGEAVATGYAARCRRAQ
ncbi:hypothetical protein WAJ14_22280, partial [Acinetobacter baumannii]